MAQETSAQTEKEAPEDERKIQVITAMVDGIAKGWQDDAQDLAFGTTTSDYLAQRIGNDKTIVDWRLLIASS